MTTPVAAPIGKTPVGKVEACKTYLEQTKLLVTLASAFLLAPAGLVAILKDKTAANLTGWQIAWFVAAEILFVLSVLAGYVAVGSLTGSQSSGKFDVFRTATRVASLTQLGFYVLGIAVFVTLVVQLVR